MPDDNNNNLSRNNPETGAEPKNIDSAPPAETAPTETIPQKAQGFWREALADKKLLFTLGGVVVLALLAGVVVYLVLFGNRTPPPPPEVSLAIELPARIVSGQEFDLTVDYANRSNSILKNMTMSMAQPTGFSIRQAQPAPQLTNGKLWQLPDMGVGQASKVKITAVLEGQIADSKDINFKLEYNLPKVSGVYSTERKATLKIDSPDLVLILNGPQETVSGQETIYNLTYRNVSPNILRGVILTLTVPPEFKISESSPAFTVEAGKIWSLGDVISNREGSIRVKGVYSQALGQDRAVEVDASETGKEGFISRAFVVTTVNNSPLALTQSVLNASNNEVRIGDNLQYKIQLTNNGDVALTNLVVSTTLEGLPYDFSSLQARGGVLAGTTITWASGGVEALKLLRPKNSITIDYTISLQQEREYLGGLPTLVKTVLKATSFELKQPILGNELQLRVSNNPGQ